MRILTISAQKPNSTGSGVYLTELVKTFHKMGYEQAALAGVYETDQVEFPAGVEFFPVYFKTEQLPFPICGMSDEMPYESTVYGQMTKTQIDQFKDEFRKSILQAYECFQPDLILCHHLYIVTSIAREVLPNATVIGFCHNTDLRQLKKIPLEKEYVLTQIPKLDRIYALHEEQRSEIASLFRIDEEAILVGGTGYNTDVFFRMEEYHMEEKSELTRLIFAGKISEKKGVASLIKALDYIDQSHKIELYLAGGAGNKEEYEWIQNLAEKCPHPIRFLGRMTQQDLAVEYNKSDIFVLPSFSEGLPLTIMEAMACGCKVVVTDLPGIRPWTEKNVEHAPVIYITPPEMEHTDEPIPESLIVFEKELAEAIVSCADMEYPGQPDLQKVSWEKVCNLALGKTE